LILHLLDFEILCWVVEELGSFHQDQGLVLLVEEVASAVSF